MSDEGFGFGMDGGGGSLGNNSITIDLGLGTTDGAYGDKFMVGTHKFAVSGEVDVNFTTGGEAQIVLPLRIIESHVEGALGQTGNDTLLIPGKDRKIEDLEKWKKMMKFLRLRLEGITGREWRQDNLELDPATAFYGCIFIATVTHKDTVKDGKTYTNANLDGYVNVQPAQTPGSAPVGFDTPKAAEEPF